MPWASSTGEAMDIGSHPFGKVRVRSLEDAKDTLSVSMQNDYLHVLGLVKVLCPSQVEHDVLVGRKSGY